MDYKIGLLASLLLHPSRKPMGEVMNRDQKKRDFISKWAHDVRTPLTVLHTYLHLSEKHVKGDERMKDFHESALFSLDKVLKLINALEDWDPQNEIKKEVADISDLMKKTLLELKVLADKEGVELKYIGPDHLLGNIDSLALERVIQNLVKNAIQAADDKKEWSTIEVRLFQRGDTFLVDVWDNGRGIAPENIGRIFEKGVTIGDHGGTGIGLAYCKEVIEKQGGTLSVHSQVGTGTLFSIIMPQAVVAACHVTHNNPSHLDVWSAEGGNNIESWIKRWQENHKIGETRRVNVHRFMLDHQEDSIDQ